MTNSITVVVLSVQILTNVQTVSDSGIYAVNGVGKSTPHCPCHIETNITQITTLGVGTNEIGKLERRLQ